MLTFTKVPKSYSNLTKIMVSQAVSDFLTDPDFGLELSSYAKRRLKLARFGNQKTTPISQIKRKYC
ncbi:hypothetical protein A3I25_02845 [Candidatus Nomurabacteria bacterium RIFCSPLOWO2_02_FULL_42_17]|uniref:Uncharacterized protein n=2 Tax=Candidatus Nomuraibacteriota TaxID=1752729 RepID=A0A1F6WI56_9BACT|nr:MAG: hypothetical protein A3B93_02115 [Candidatus Nomurabacteria bacterium RIFCSPHIGHO2_02_FULL_42_24]OGI97591.1 MAG: hypothetical protein A3I25_02845 [Candidatus Nomurabacteria bacterium RIFCSPLOWO2_02_FULL_42_17]